MRRKEREVKEPEEILKILSSCKIMRVAFNDGGHIYVVPVNFGFEYSGGKLSLFFHGARDGRKFGLIQKGGNVGFEMDADYQLMTAETACAHSAFYSSIIGEGEISEVLESESKKSALNLIMLNATGKGSWNFPSIMIKKVGVFKIEATNFSCKAHRMPKA